jgi:hypothetical protein
VPDPETSRAIESQEDDDDDDDDDMDDVDDQNGVESSAKAEPAVRSEPMGEMMSAPPSDGSYASLEAVQKAVLKYCTSVGYAVVIGRSKKTVQGLKKVLFVCDRAGKPPSRVTPESRKRKTSSRKCDCRFGFFAIEQRSQWIIRYRPDARHLEHNHGPSESPSLHPAARKLDGKMVAQVKQLKDNGVGVNETLQIMRNDNPAVHLLPRDIYNARAAINRNPAKVETGLAENRPTIYNKPGLSVEERIKTDLRQQISQLKDQVEAKDRELADKDKIIADLHATIKERDAKIVKYEIFVDLCNDRRGRADAA